MSTKQIFIIIGLILLIGGTAAFIYSKNQPSPEMTVKVTYGEKAPTPTPVTLLTWTDEAGFSFQYPEGTQIDKHPEDTQNYANLTLTLPSKEILNIKMADNTFKNLDAWVGQNSALDTTVEGRPAKKIIVGDLETVAVIDNEVLVTISGKDTSGVVSSWTFIYPTPTASKNTGAPTDENVLVEE